MVFLSVARMQGEEGMNIPEQPKRRVFLNPCFQIKARNPFSRDRKNMTVSAPYTKMPITVRDTIHERASNTGGSS
jgi:hypothetical protein